MWDAITPKQVQKWFNAQQEWRMGLWITLWRRNGHPQWWRRGLVMDWVQVGYQKCWVFPWGFLGGGGYITNWRVWVPFLQAVWIRYPPKILSIWVPEPITSCGGSRNRHHTKVAEFLDGQDLIDNFMDYYDSMESIGFLFSRLCNCIETEKSVFQCKIR